MDEGGGRPTANNYVDGFNLYRQKIEHHRHTKWLDLESLAKRMLPTHDIQRVRYFTALVRPIFGSDKQSPIRQRVYIEALLTNPKLSVHYGQFRVDKRRMPTYPLRTDDAGKLVTVPVRKIEEKGTDVSLASYMLLDAFNRDADLDVLVSNDSDFAEPRRIVKNELGRNIGVFTPTESLSTALEDCVPLFHKRIRRGTLEDSQLPDQLAVGNRTIRKPSTWYPDD